VKKIQAIGDEPQSVRNEHRGIRPVVVGGKDRADDESSYNIRPPAVAELPPGPATSPGVGRFVCVLIIGHKNLSFKHTRVQSDSRGEGNYLCLLREQLPTGTELQIPVPPLLPRDGVPISGSMSSTTPIFTSRGTIGLALVTIVEPTTRARTC